MNKKTLKLKHIGKKTYYRDPLKGVLRNIENPRDVHTPETTTSLSRLLERIRVYE